MSKHLKSCNACGNTISRHSPFCRHCGHPQVMPLAIWLLVLFLLFLVAFYIACTLYGLSHIQEFRVEKSPAALPACVCPLLFSWPPRYTPSRWQKTKTFRPL